MAGGRPWSDTEDSLIRERYPLDGPNLDVAGRARQSIIARASILGVKYCPGMTQLLIERGLDPDDWHASSAWVKDKGLSLKVHRKEPDWKEILSSLKPGKVPQIARADKPSGQMLEVAEVDGHYGKLSWAPESGSDYDLQIADERHRAASLEFAGRLSKDRFDRVLLLGGQDSLHIANPEGTTSKGTALDYDGRFQKIVKKRIEYEVWRLDLWRRFGPVTYISSPGNHSFVAEMMLTEVLKAWFKDADVKFMDAPSDRQYLQFGKVGLGFSHGDHTKLAKAPSLFAAEAPKIWGDTEFREFHCGHLHSERVVQTPGCTARTLRALCAADKWHSDQGWVSMPGTQAFIWDKSKGLRATLDQYA